MNSYLYNHTIHSKEAIDQQNAKKKKSKKSEMLTKLSEKHFVLSGTFPY